MCKMTKCGACDSLKDELSVHIAEKAKGHSHSLKKGFSAVDLCYYILTDYRSGELIKFADFLDEGYSKQSLFKLKNRMLEKRWIERVATRGWYRVIC